MPTSSKKSLELHFTTKKIREYDAENLKALYASLLALCKLIGVTEAPDKDTIQLLIKHLQEFHPDFSGEEVIRAFNLATAGKLNFEFKHYNRVTPQLLSHTLNKYKELRNKDLIVFNREEQRQLSASESIEPTEEEKLELSKKGALAMFENYVNEKNAEQVLIPVRDYGNVVYNFLDKIGVIEISDEEKSQLMDRAREVSMNKAMSKGSKAVRDFKDKEDRGDKTEVISEAKQIAVKDFFEMVINTKKDLKYLIDSKL